MTVARDRWALAVAGAATAVLVVTAYGFWRDSSTGDPWIAVVAIPIHVLATAAWLGRPSIQRRLVVAFGIAEIIVGAGYFATAPILRGRFAPPGQPLISTAQVWGLAGLAVAGVLIVVAGLIHSSPTVHDGGDE